MQQLSLFDYAREERAAIVEYDSGQCRTSAEKAAGIQYQYRGPMPYLRDLIRDREPLIHLFGQNPHVCLVRSLATYEPDVAKKRAWVSRVDATRALKSAGYYHHAFLELQGIRGEIWRLNRKAKDGKTNRHPIL